MENLGIDIKLLIAQLVNFALFFVILKRFVAKPFNKFLNQEIEKQKEKEQMLDDIKKQQEEALAQKLKEEEKMKKAYAVAIAQAKQDGDNVRRELTTQAKAEAAEIIEKAKRQLVEERMSLYKEAKDKVADLSILIVEKVLKQYLLPEAQKKVVIEILKNLPKEVD